MNSSTKITATQTAMERTIAIIVKGQQDGGGFDYLYTKGKRWDVSITSWQVQAIKAAHLAGSSNPGLRDAIRKAVKFLRGPISDKSDGTFAYSTTSRISSLTGAGALSLQ